MPRKSNFLSNQTKKTGNTRNEKEPSCQFTARVFLAFFWARMRKVVLGSEILGATFVLPPKLWSHDEELHERVDAVDDAITLSLSPLSPPFSLYYLILFPAFATGLQLLREALPGRILVLCFRPVNVRIYDVHLIPISEFSVVVFFFLIFSNRSLAILL